MSKTSLNQACAKEYRFFNMKKETRLWMIAMGIFVTFAVGVHNLLMVQFQESFGIMYWYAITGLILIIASIHIFKMNFMREEDDK